MSHTTNRNTVDIKLPVGGRITIGSRVKPNTHGVSSVVDVKKTPSHSQVFEPNIIIGSKKQIPVDNSLSIVTKPRITPVQVIQSGPIIVLPDLNKQIKIEMAKLDTLETQIDALEKSINNQKVILQTQPTSILTTAKIVLAPKIKNIASPSTPKSLANTPTTHSYSSNSMLYLTLSGFCLALMPLVFLTLPKTFLMINSFLLLLVLGFFYGFQRCKFLEARANLKDQMYESLQQILDQKSNKPLS